MGNLIQVDEEEYQLLKSIKTHLDSRVVDSKFIKELRALTYLKCDGTEGRRHRHVITGYSKLEDGNILFKGYLISLYNELLKR